MAETEPWILFHAPWTERAKSGMVLFERIQRFLAACAVDPAPDALELRIWERIAETPPPIVTRASEAFGAGERRAGGDGRPGALAHWTWERRARDGAPIPPDEAAAFVAFYREHEHLPPVEGSAARRAAQLMINHWFEVKRPGTHAPLFPGATLRSAVMIWLDSRHANLSVRYQASELTPELRAAHADIVAALGPKTPRHAFQRIIPARTPGGRERREPIT